MEKNLKCCFCKKQLQDYGNNPAPANNDPKARCCDFCNHTIVMPARVPHLAAMFTEETYKEQLQAKEKFKAGGSDDR